MPTPQWTHKFELKKDCWVFVPNDITLERGLKIKEDIESKWSSPYYYYHLNPGGHVSAMKKHISNKYFIKADIEQFFNSINRSRVTRSLKKIFKKYDIARSIACESVVLKPNSGQRTFILPFGFVQSAIIASICLQHSSLGKFLDKLEGSGFKVSVYMDDIIISTSVAEEEAVAAFDVLQEKASKSGFIFSDKKTVGPTDSVTAFNIVLSNMNLQVSDSRIDEFESVLKESNNPSVLNGILNYIKTINVEQAKSLRELISQQ